jgi:hypothetical protein
MQALSRLTKHEGNEPSLPSGYDPEAVSFEIARAMQDLVSAITNESPIVMLLEDAHWLDEGSLRLLAELVSSREWRRLLVLVTTRDKLDLSSRTRFADRVSTVAVRGLDSPTARQLCDLELTDVASDNPALRDWIAEASGGNPLFLSSLASHYRSTGVPFAVPASLRELLGHRLDALSRPATAVLQACVTLGKHCTTSRLVASLGMSPIELLTSIAELDAAHLILSGARSLAPAHPLISEVLQQRTASATLHLLHHSIAEVLQAEATREAATGLLWQCAEHWVEAGENGKALAALRICADHAVTIGQPRAAAEVLLRAATLKVDRLTKRNLLRQMVLIARSGREFELVLRGADSLSALGHCSEHDDVELAELDALIGTHRGSLDAEKRLLSCVASDGADIAHRVRAGLAILKYADVYSKPQLASSVASAISSQELDAVDELLRLEYNLVYHSAFGDSDAAVRMARSLQQHASGLEPVRRAGLQFNAANAYLRAGRVGEATTATRESFDVAMECGACRLAMVAAIRMAGILGDEGEAQEARTWRHKAAAVRAQYPDLTDGFEIAVSEIEAALSNCDAQGAAAFLADATNLGLFNFPARDEWRRAFELRLRQLGDRPELADLELEKLLRESRSHGSGIRDLEIAIALFELCRRDRVADARTVLFAYLREQRRSRAPIGQILRQAITEGGLRGVRDGLQVAD